jgi:hypothetical protein
LNLRFQLRAYESANACRLAKILEELAASGGRSFSRDDIADHWARLFPRNAGQTGKRSIRSRISRSIGPMRTAGMITVDGDDITAADLDLLAMSARNLPCVTNDEGDSVPPREWSSRPEVPTHLQPVQEPLEASRQAVIAGLRETAQPEE